MGKILESSRREQVYFLNTMSYTRCIVFSSFLLCRCSQALQVCIVEEDFDSGNAWWTFLVFPPCFLLHCINALLKHFVQHIFESKFSSLWYFLQERELHSTKYNVIYSLTSTVIQRLWLVDCVLILTIEKQRKKTRVFG